MTQISKYPVRKEVEKRMFEILQTTISSLVSTSEIDSFLNEFLSPVEKIILAKRLAIALLLEKGYDYSTIRSILKVTPSTISHVSLQLKFTGKGYKLVVQKILRNEKFNVFWQKVEEVIMHIPPSKGYSLVKLAKERAAVKRSYEKPF